MIGSQEEAEEAERKANPPVVVEWGDRRVVLVGTAHVSQRSVEEVSRVLREETPDVVCVELDEDRHRALSESSWWTGLDLWKVIRERRVSFLIANLILSSYQRRVGMETGVRPGSELMEAARLGEESGCDVVLCDRPIRTTLLRAWRGTGWWHKMQLLAGLVGSVILPEESVTEEDLARLQEGDVLSGLLEELGDTMPSLKTVLVDERDRYMAEQIRKTAGKRVVAVVGAAHVPGIRKILESEESEFDLETISRIPEPGRFSRLLPFFIPALVIGVFVIGFFLGDGEAFKEAALAWVLSNGAFASLGALAAGGHPLTIFSAFVAAPLTSLNPAVGAGMVTALVQTFFRPPHVGDMEGLSEDLQSWRGWWQNRFARILLVFVFSNLGSTIGTFVAFGWLKELV
ncbi:MAG: TraB/GumN family protein [Planctomycetota bacterium]|nr:TraB/GumN family protein [Planctomycetota bacterium]